MSSTYSITYESNGREYSTVVHANSESEAKQKTKTHAGNQNITFIKIVKISK